MTHTAPKNKMLIHLCKSWVGRPVCKPRECRHAPEDVLAINQRLERAGKGHRVAIDAIICMACGNDKTGQMNFVKGLSACWDEHGWNHEVVQRLYEIVEHRQSELKWQRVPIWFCTALNFTQQQINHCLSLA